LFTIKKATSIAFSIFQFVHVQLYIDSEEGIYEWVCFKCHIHAIDSHHLTDQWITREITLHLIQTVPFGRGVQDLLKKTQRNKGPCWNSIHHLKSDADVNEQHRVTSSNKVRARKKNPLQPQQPHVDRQKLC
jgi:hypothetical protein